MKFPKKIKISPSLEAIDIHPVYAGSLQKPGCRNFLYLKLRCDNRFQRAFTACSCVFKEITLV